MARKKTAVIILCLIIAAILLVYLVFSTIMSNPTTLYLNPQTIKGEVGQDFIVNVSISNVVDLYGWQLQLGWNNSILDVVNVTEGSFLRSHEQTTFVQKINETGSLLLLCTSWYNVSGVNGSGVLATIKFEVAGKGECNLPLYGTILVSSSGTSIAHSVKGGKFST